jgi:hypothetical protein
MSKATTVVARVSPWSKQLIVGLTSPGTHVSSSVVLWARFDFVKAMQGGFPPPSLPIFSGGERPAGGMLSHRLSLE